MFYSVMNPVFYSKRHVRVVATFRNYNNNNKSILKKVEMNRLL